MINVTEERREQKKKLRQKTALKLVCDAESYLYTVFSVPEQKCEGGKGVGDYNTVGPPL